MEEYRRIKHIPPRNLNENQLLKGLLEFTYFKRRKVWSVSTRLYTEGQLKERSEGYKHSGKPRSEKRLASGVLTDFVKLAALLIARCVPKDKSQVPSPRSKVNILY
jgi:hypothetical protein